MYVYYNPNPLNKKTTDCVIRMLCKVLGLDWTMSYLELSTVVLSEYEMPSSNYIWETLLLEHGFKKRLLPTTCPVCMKVRDFVNLHRDGTFVLCTGSHVVAAIDGKYYDAWDSGDEVVAYYFVKQ